MISQTESNRPQQRSREKDDARVGGKRAILVTEAIQNKMNVSPVKVLGICQDGDCIKDARM